MYLVKILVIKEEKEIEIRAKYCFVDGNNNLVFQDKIPSTGEPERMIHSNRWVDLKRLD